MGTLYLVRHGQASFGADDYDQLSPLGRQQAVRLGEYLRPKLQGKPLEAVLMGSLKRHRQTWEGIAEGAQPLVFNGISGVMVNAPGAFHSVVGDLLSKQGHAFALTWSIDKTGAVKAGLRSQRNFNCIPLAESLGGGGHAQACGFKMSAARLPELLSGEFVASR